MPSATGWDKVRDVASPELIARARAIVEHYFKPNLKDRAVADVWMGEEHAQALRACLRELDNRARKGRLAP
jgi:hypothetical protein